MKVNLTAAASHESPIDPVAISLTIRPSCRIPGDYTYATDRRSLYRLLDSFTDVPRPLLQEFFEGARKPAGARLLSVNMDDRALREIGYFVD